MTATVMEIVAEGELVGLYCDGCADHATPMSDDEVRWVATADLEPGSSCDECGLNVTPQQRQHDQSILDWYRNLGRTI